VTRCTSVALGIQCALEEGHDGLHFRGGHYWDDDGHIDPQYA
jgi:hypothetical protein